MHWFLGFLYGSKRHYSNVGLVLFDYELCNEGILLGYILGYFNSLDLE